MFDRESYKMLRRLAAAEGYLELGMPAHALDELEAVEDAGEFESTRQYLKGEALKAQKRYTDAVGPLHKAAETLPIQFSGRAWLALSECFRESGYNELAEVAALTAGAVQELVDQLDSGVNPGETRLLPLLHGNGRETRRRIL